MSYMDPYITGAGRIVEENLGAQLCQEKAGRQRDVQRVKPGQGGEMASYVGGCMSDDCGLCDTTLKRFPSQERR